MLMIVLSMQGSLSVMRADDISSTAALGRYRCTRNTWVMGALCNTTNSVDRIRFCPTEYEFCWTELHSVDRM